MTSRAEHSAVAPTGTSLVYLRTRKKVDEVAEKRSCKGMVGGKVKGSHGLVTSGLGGSALFYLGYTLLALCFIDIAPI